MVPGIEGIRRFLDAVKVAFPYILGRVYDVVSEGDLRRASRPSDGIVVVGGKPSNRFKDLFITAEARRSSVKMPGVSSGESMYFPNSM